MRIFISHSQEDAAAYSSLCLVLDGVGISRWDPTRLHPGKSLAEQLRLAIVQCEVCVLVATRRSLKSQWCLAEVGAFWGAGKTVMGYIADPEIKESQLPPQFSGNFWTSDAGRLVAAIKEIEDSKRVWVTEWRLGSKLYREELILRIDSVGMVWGERKTTLEGKNQTIYRVTGHAENGFWWLEYHDESETGGGTILLKTLTDRMLRGVVVSVNCTTGRMRCVGNSWVKACNEKEYEPHWQVLLSEFATEFKGV